MAGSSEAIIGRSAPDATRLATADDQAYASYYELLHAGVRLPSGDHWDRLRGLADLELFGSYRDKIRFAALSADGSWLTHYVAVAIVLSEAMIAHRTTVFIETLPSTLKSNASSATSRRSSQAAEPLGKTAEN